MNPKPKGGLSKPMLKDKQVEVNSVSVVIQTYVHVILQQPDLKLDALPDLPKHQKTARDHANNWNSNISPNMAKVNADVIDYANKFDSFYEDLVKYAKEIQNPESKKKLVEGLQLLSSTINQKHANAHEVVKILATFQVNLNADSRNFTKDADEAAVKIEGKDGELKSLGTKIDAIHSAMDKDVALMAGGAAAIIVGALVIAIGVIAEIETFGLATGVVVAGIAVVAGGVTMEVVAGLDYDKKIGKLKSATEELARDKQQLVGLKTAKHQILGFVNGLASAITAATALKNTWQDLDADLIEVITAVKDVDPSTSGVWLLDELNRAKKDWEVALEKAKQLQVNCEKVPMKVYKNIQDAFKGA